VGEAHRRYFVGDSRLIGAACDCPMLPLRMRSVKAQRVGVLEPGVEYAYKAGMALI